MQTISWPDIKKQVLTLEKVERFFDSVVIFALFEIGVFRSLATGPKTAEELQSAVSGSDDNRSLLAALNAAVALKVLSKDGDRYAASESMLDCLGREDSPAYLGEWVSFIHALATPLMKLGDEIKSGSKPGALFEDMSSDNAPAKLMTKAMDAYARTRGIEIADRIDFSKTQRFLDLGCGPGTYTLAIIEKFPHIKATLLDLPGPIAEARRLVENRGMSDRVEFVVSDGRDYHPKEPFDTVLVSNTLHMIGSTASQQLLQHCFKLISSGGRLIVQAQYLNDDFTSPRWPTLLNLLQRIGTPDGRNHAIGETTQWMEDAGFVDIELFPFSPWNVCRALVGKRP